MATTFWFCRVPGDISRSRMDAWCRPGWPICWWAGGVWPGTEPATPPWGQNTVMITRATKVSVGESLVSKVLVWDMTVTCLSKESNIKLVDLMNILHIHVCLGTWWPARWQARVRGPQLLCQSRWYLLWMEQTYDHVFEQEGVSTHDVDIKLVQKELLRQGVKIHWFRWFP